MTNPSFQIIPVLDLKGGRAVHAVAGQRAHYQPVCSILHPSSDPLELAQACREKLGLATLYLADLDAITGDAPSIELYTRLLSLGFRLIIDAGLRNARSAGGLLDLEPGSTSIVAALETLDGPEELSELLHKAGPERLVFSLDLFDGQARVAAPHAWKSHDPLELACIAIERGARRLLLLDLARVGTGRGPGTSAFISRILAIAPDVQITAGGGISDLAGVLELRRLGAVAALVGSAFHDGRIGRRELAQLTADE